MPKPRTSRTNETFSQVSNELANCSHQIELVAPHILKPSKRNARTHNEGQIGLLANSILRFGFIKPVVVNDQGQIVAGHGTWLAAKKLGLRRIPTVRVSHLSETELRAYAVADNQLATKSGWDLDVLSVEFDELAVALPEIGLDLSMLGFDVSDIDRVLEDFTEDAPASDAIDAIPELGGPTVSRAGDVFLGQARRRIVFQRLGNLSFQPDADRAQQLFRVRPQFG